MCIIYLDIIEAFNIIIFINNLFVNKEKAFH